MQPTDLILLRLRWAQVLTGGGSLPEELSTGDASSASSHGEGRGFSLLLEFRVCAPFGVGEVRLCFSLDRLVWVWLVDVSSATGGFQRSPMAFEASVSSSLDLLASAGPAFPGVKRPLSTRLVLLCFFGFSLSADTACGFHSLDFGLRFSEITNVEMVLGRVIDRLRVNIWS
ncbi:hypothetical protein Bca52824_010195 [Brassica carinata]|uniref:Uncharacterized protein n=1 Tax=Brassica carinata TaxID=52824 RepID=A0A8X7WDQ8_BRACI|nr:hypothetical protein Bca52824_010195 [Brassica carinata]